MGWVRLSELERGCFSTLSDSLWNAALDLGIKHTRGLQALFRLMSYLGVGVKPGPIWDVSGSLACSLDHALNNHHGILKLRKYLLAKTDFNETCLKV